MPKTPKTLRGSFNPALRPLPSVVSGLQARRLPAVRPPPSVVRVLPAVRPLSSVVKGLQACRLPAVRPLPSVVKGLQACRADMCWRHSLWPQHSPWLTLHGRSQVEAVRVNWWLLVVEEGGVGGTRALASPFVVEAKFKHSFSYPGARPCRRPTPKILQPAGVFTFLGVRGGKKDGKKNWNCVLEVLAGRFLVDFWSIFHNFLVLSRRKNRVIYNVFVPLASKKASDNMQETA